MIGVFADLEQMRRICKYRFSASHLLLSGLPERRVGVFMGRHFD